jgi:hypothetical protein
MPHRGRADFGKLTIEKMRLDESGFPQPTGEFTALDADAVVLALGQEAELALLDGVLGATVADGVVQVGTDLMTGHPGIFAGGDMVPAERSATVAIGHGKRAAAVWTSSPPCSRRGALSCGNCFECDNCSGICPDNAVIKLAPGQRYQNRPGLLQGLRDLRHRVSVRRHRHGPRADLIR